MAAEDARKAGDGTAPVGMFANSTHNPVFNAKSKDAQTYHKKDATKELYEEELRKDAIRNKAAFLIKVKRKKQREVEKRSSIALGSESNHSEKQPDEDIVDQSDFDDTYEDKDTAEHMVNPMYNEDGALHTNATDGTSEKVTGRAAALAALKKKEKKERKKERQEIRQSRKGREEERESRESSMIAPNPYSEANDAGGYYDDNNQWNDGLFAPDGTFYRGYYDDDYNWVDLEEASFSLDDFTDEQGDFSYTNSAAGQGYEGQGEGGAEEAGYYEGGEGHEEEGYAQNKDYYNNEYSNEERGSEMVSMQAGSTHNPMTDDQVDITQYAVDDDAV